VNPCLSVAHSLQTTGVLRKVLRMPAGWTPPKQQRSSEQSAASAVRKRDARARRVKYSARFGVFGFPCKHRMCPGIDDLPQPERDPPETRRSDPRAHSPVRPKDIQSLRSQNDLNGGIPNSSLYSVPSQVEKRMFIDYHDPTPVTSLLDAT
jgi:hypothetical protein